MEILYVCTGNLCRSPMAERLLHARRPDLAVSSAGTGAVVGFPMDPVVAGALREVGGDPDGHVARMLTPELVDAADLVLTAERYHRDLILAHQPAAMAKVFTIIEYGRLAAAGPGPVRRGRDSAADDLPDPYRLGVEPARVCARRLVELTDALSTHLGT